MIRLSATFELVTGKEKMALVNGCIMEDKVFESHYTFYRGDSRSHNDLILSNAMHNIESFSIMDNLICSDHTPTSVLILVNPNISLHQLRSCSDGVSNDDHQ